MLVYACGISMEISELRVKNLCLRLEWCSWHFAEKIASYRRKKMELQRLPTAEVTLLEQRVRQDCQRLFQHQIGIRYD